MKRLAVALVLAAIGSAACAPTGMLFHQDRRVHIDAPTRNEEVSLPLTIRWSLHRDHGDVGDIASFGVFFDGDPQPPGSMLAHVARHDLVCKRTPGCPDATYLASRGIFRTTDTSLRIERLRPANGQGRLRGAKKQPHEVTIVALDAEGRRLNEAAWTRRFVIVEDVFEL